MVAAGSALGLYVVGVIVTFGVRTVLHRRATGDSGLRRPSGAGPADAQWWGQALFVVALVAGFLSPLAVLTGLAAPVQEHLAATVAGAVLALAGFGLVVVSQGQMGRSWRIGVDTGERTDLVSDGVFARVRNPIFTGMVAALAGLVLMVPAWPGLLAVVALVVAVQLQVRAVEEPYLLRTHGPSYRAYAARAGRFLPGIGRLRVAAGQERSGGPQSPGFPSSSPLSSSDDAAR